jgi:hypothetical protein
MINVLLDVLLDTHPLSLASLFLCIGFLMIGVVMLVGVSLEEFIAHREHKVRMAVVRKRRGW